MAGRVVLVLALAGGLYGDEQSQRLAARLSQQAEQFERVAPQVVATETLHQRAVRPPPRMHLLTGDFAKVGWQQREIVSEYGFAVFAGDGGGLHEIRQVTSIDRKPVRDTKRAQEALAKAVTTRDEGIKRQLLKDFQRHGLLGAVTDCGQSILLFQPKTIERYEFAFERVDQKGPARILVFHYKQLDGPGAITVFEANRDRAQQVAIEGEVWVTEADQTLVRITLVATQGSEAAAVREEMTVDYEASPVGAVMPISTAHRELRGGRVVAENQFTYENFHKFTTSSDIRFDEAK